MTAKELMESLQAEENAQVLIHDASTGKDVPIGRIDQVYGQPIVLHGKHPRNHQGSSHGA